MKKILVSLALLILLSACGSKVEKETASAELEQEALRKASMKLIKSFGAELKGELISAFNEEGSSHAIEVCSESAPVIAKKYSDESWSIKRVSDKSRNPLNMASEHEKEILSIFSDSLESSGFFFDEWVKTDSSEYYYFYKPVKIGQLCLKCHGSDEVLGDETKTALSELYPEDNAVGYNTGDLRGMFVVEVKWPEGKKFSETLLNDSL